MVQHFVSPLLDNDTKDCPLPTPLSTLKSSQVSWCTPVIPAFQVQRQEDHFKFKANCLYSEFRSGGELKTSKRAGAGFKPPPHCLIWMMRLETVGRVLGSFGMF